MQKKKVESALDESWNKDEEGEKSGCEGVRGVKRETVSLKGKEGEEERVRKDVGGG